MVAFGAVFAAFALLLAGPVAPAPGTPAPTPTPGPLRQIGTVRVTTPLCRALVERAGEAVAVETENDARLDTVIGSLGTIDLDSSQLAKQNGEKVLLDRYVALREAAVRGNGIMKQFRAEAATAPEDRRAALEQFADALDGALHRQKIIADTLGRFVAYVETHEPISNEEHDRMVFATLLQQNGASHSAGGAQPTLDDLPPQLSAVAKDASKDLAERARRIADDENDAATRMDPAFTQC
jgi:hypothetical protein